MNNVRNEAGLARQGKLKRHLDSEVNAVAAKTSVKALLPSLHDKPVPILRTLRSASHLGGLHIRDRNNQRHVLLQRYTCERVRLEREANGLHNSCNFCSILRKCSRNDLRRPEIINFPGGHSPRRYTCIYALLETPLRIFAYASEAYSLMGECKDGMVRIGFRTYRKNCEPY